MLKNYLFEQKVTPIWNCKMLIKLCTQSSYQSTCIQSPQKKIYKELCVPMTETNTFPLTVLLPFNRKVKILVPWPSSTNSWNYWTSLFRSKRLLVSTKSICACHELLLMNKFHQYALCDICLNTIISSLCNKVKYHRPLLKL